MPSRAPSADDDANRPPIESLSPEPCEDDDLQLHDSKAVRVLLTTTGIVCIALGAIGVLLPIVPTVPFLLLAAACFARASPRFYRRLVTSKTFGPPILEWRRHHSIPWRTKLFAMGLFFVSFTTSTLLFVRPLVLQLIFALIGAGILLYLYRIPSRDRPQRG